MTGKIGKIEIVLDQPVWSPPYARRTFTEFLVKWKDYQRKGGRKSIFACVPAATLDLVGIESPSLFSIMDYTEVVAPDNAELVTKFRAYFRYASWSLFVEATRTIRCDNLLKVHEFIENWEKELFFLPEGTEESNEDVQALIVNSIKIPGLKNEVKHQKEQYKTKSFMALRKIILAETVKAQTLQETARVFMNPREGEDHTARAYRPTNKEKRKSAKPEPAEAQTMARMLPDRETMRRKRLCFNCGLSGHQISGCPTGKPKAEPTIEVNINNIMTVAFIDAGSDENFIDSEFVNKFESKFNIQSKCQYFKTGNGILETKYICSTIVTLNRKELKVEFVVAPINKLLNHTIILGKPYLMDRKLWNKYINLVTENESIVKLSCDGRSLKILTRNNTDDSDSAPEVAEMVDFQKQISNEGIWTTISTKDQQFAKRIHTIVGNYKEIFSEKLPAGGALMEPLTIELLPNETMKMAKVRYYNEIISKKLKEEIHRLLKENVIRESTASHACNTVVLLKPDNSVRLCINYTPLNKITKRLVYPLPDVKQILNNLKGTKYFAKLDLSQGYYQIRMAEESKNKTAFICEFGVYEFNRVPFGLRNAPNHFQKQINKVLSKFIGSSCYCFIDDIIIFARTQDQFIEALNNILYTLHQHDIRIKLAKCSFGVEEIKFLGYTVNKESIEMDKSKKDAILSLACPTTKQEWRSFLGMANYHRAFIPNYSQLSAPLYELVKQNTTIKVNASLTEVFEKLKEAIYNTGKLFHIDYDHPLRMQCDASKKGIGVVLFQLINNQKYIVAYASRKFSKAEVNWSTIEAECFAIVFGLEHFSSWILGHKVIIETDHNNLRYLDSTSIPKLVRWRMKIQEYDFEIKHIKGKDNIEADTLSRLLNISSTTVQQNIQQVHNDLIGHFGVGSTLKKLQELKFQWAKMKEDVEKYIAECPLCQKVRLGKLPFQAAIHTSAVTEPGKVWIFDSIGPLPETKSGNKYILVAEEAFTRFIEVFPTKQVSSQDYIKPLLNLIGRYGIPEAVRTDNGPQFASELGQHIEQIFNINHQFTQPYRSESNGIVERVNKEVMRHLKILVNSTKKYDQWDVLLPLSQRIINSSYHSAIGTIPGRLLFGPHWKIPKTLEEFKPKHTEHNNKRNIAQYMNEFEDYIIKMIGVAQAHQNEVIMKRLSKSPVKPDSIQSGDWILVEYPNAPPNKLVPMWRGPFVVTGVLSEGNRLQIQDPRTNKIKIVHITQVKIFKGDPGRAEDLNAMDQTEYVIDTIIDHELRKRKKNPTYKDYHFLVRWQGYEDSDNTWLPYAELKDTEAMDKYLLSNEIK